MKEPQYKIRYFFEFGASGPCLWSANDEARAKYGYPIAPEKLPLLPATIQRIHEMGKWFQDSLNWQSPLDPGPWRQEECDRFNDAARKLFDQIQAELGEQFALSYEQRDEMEDPDLDEYLRDPKGFKRKD
jgi:hypothetical protein